jgi:hypothetical protein
MRTSTVEPLFSLTASITLREKPNIGIIAGYEHIRNRELGRRKSTRSAFQEDTLDESELHDIDLLAGLGSSSFASSSISTFSLGITYDTIADNLAYHCVCF